MNKPDVIKHIRRNGIWLIIQTIDIKQWRPTSQAFSHDIFRLGVCPSLPMIISICINMQVLVWVLGLVLECEAHREFDQPAGHPAMESSALVLVPTLVWVLVFAFEWKAKIRGALQQPNKHPAMEPSILVLDPVSIRILIFDVESNIDLANHPSLQNLLPPASSHRILCPCLNQILGMSISIGSIMCT